MRSLYFVDKNKSVIKVKVEFRDYVSITGQMGGTFGQIYDNILPASTNQKKLLALWETYHLKPYTEEIKAEIEQAVDALQAEVQEEEDKFLETFGTRKLWEYLHDEVEFTEDDPELSKRVQAIFDAMEWPYHFVDKVDFAESEHSLIEIGDNQFYCDLECNMQDIALDCLDDDEGRYLWRCAVDGQQTEKGFYDWCEEVCDWGNWCEVLDRYDGRGTTIDIDATDYWVGRA